MFKKFVVSTAIVGAIFAQAGVSQAREQIRIVGSSTVFPFATTVAERFGRTTRFKTPIIESTGSGGGFKLFCASAGDNSPDITNASRRIEKSEIKRCARSGITAITEIKIGYDGIVVANSKKAERLSLSLRDIYLALAKNVPNGEGKTQPNPYKTWKAVDPALPAIKIKVLGPPPTSGTRDAFAELAMEGGCKTFSWIKAMKKKNKRAYKELCHTLREDGAYIEAGENDNLIVQKLGVDRDALGIFGYSYLEQNSDRIQGSLIDNVAPTFDNIADAKYPISRPLFFYVKKSHIGKVPGIPEYIKEFTSEKAWGDDGYLVDKGLIPMSAEERKNSRQASKSLPNVPL